VVQICIALCSGEGLGVGGAATYHVFINNNKHVHTLHTFTTTANTTGF